MQFRRFMAVLSARNKEFLRDRMALSWNIILPVMIVIGFAFAFSTDDTELFKVGVIGEQGSETETFIGLRHIQFIPIKDTETALRKVERHQLDMLLDRENNRFWINDQSANGYVLEKLLQSESSAQVRRDTVTGQQIRYVDWLIPGVLGMNVMFSSLFGVGYVIVRYRKNGVLKRLKATPLSSFEFLSAQVISRLWLIVAVSALVYMGTDLFVGFQMYGSYITLLLVLIMGTLSMISLGLIVAARLSNEEAANGLLNMASWPMMLLSGVWFSLEGSPDWVILLADLFPLTHTLNAARAVMIDGASLLDISHHLVILLAMTIIFMTIGARTFRWE